MDNGHVKNIFTVIIKNYLRFCLYFVIILFCYQFDNGKRSRMFENMYLYKEIINYQKSNTTEMSRL